MNVSGRRGFSLMEVLLATSILLGSVIVLSELARIGRSQAARSQDLATAELLCLDKLNEILVGLAPLEAVQDVPFDEKPGWVYSVTVEPVESTGLVAVRVEVGQDEDAPTGPTARTSRTSAKFTLVRWVRDASTDDRVLAVGEGTTAAETGFRGVGGPLR